jgi:hypothetical protein
VRAIIIFFEIHVNSTWQWWCLSAPPAVQVNQPPISVPIAPKVLVREAGDGEFADASYDRASLAGSVEGGSTRCAIACPR